MSQQALDLRRSVQIVRRHKILVGAVTAFGVLAGAGYGALYPPMFTSTALVALPQAAASSTQPAQAGTTGTSGYMATQTVVASSDPVLSGAIPRTNPKLGF
jgi:uncharacterized protein involved in exopolysaccharide biosynthesis